MKDTNGTEQQGKNSICILAIAVSVHVSASANECVRLCVGFQVHAPSKPVYVIKTL